MWHCAKSLSLERELYTHCFCKWSYLLPTSDILNCPIPSFPQNTPLMQHKWPKAHLLTLSFMEVCPFFPFSLLQPALPQPHTSTYRSARSIMTRTKARGTFQYWEGPASHTAAPAGNGESWAKTLPVRQLVRQTHCPRAYELANCGFWIRLGLTTSCAVRYNKFQGFMSPKFLVCTSYFCFLKEMLLFSYSGEHCTCCYAATAVHRWLRATLEIQVRLVQPFLFFFCQLNWTQSLSH